MILDFGKYKGKSIDSIYQIDAGYARWLMNQDILVNKSPEIKDVYGANSTLTILPIL